MTSVVAICNLALSNLAKDNIQSLDDAGAEAKACRQFYEHTRDTLLQVYPWRFASRTVSLAELTNDNSEWLHCYARPTDCLKIRSIGPTRSVAAQCDAGPSPLPYDAAGIAIYSDASPVFLNYTSRLADVTKFSPLFVEALSWHLAVKLATPLTRDPKMRADAYQLAMATQGKAEMADANETRDTSDHESELIAGRA